MSNGPNDRKFHPEKSPSVQRVGASGSIILDPPIYRAYMAPDGFLTTDPASHALFHYYITALEVWKSEKDKIVLEGDANRINLHQLFLSVANLFGVNPNDMARFWPAVDLQVQRLGLTKLPNDPFWRSPKRGLN